MHMLDLAQASEIVDILDLWRMLPQWINLHHERDGERRYTACEATYSSSDSLTLFVDLTGPTGRIASYKCEIFRVYDAGKSWLVFSPLVVIWELSRADRGPGIGQAIIEHFVAAVRTFHEARGTRAYDIVIASGNLTVAKGGKPFFETIGWEIVVPSACEPHYLFNGEQAMAKPLDIIKAQIEAAIAPLRAAGKVAETAISFAILRLV
jgi:hypothetical protein